MSAMYHLQQLDALAIEKNSIHVASIDEELKAKIIKDVDMRIEFHTKALHHCRTPFGQFADYAQSTTRPEFNTWTDTRNAHKPALYEVIEIPNPDVAAAPNPFFAKPTAMKWKMLAVCILGILIGKFFL